MNLLNLAILLFLYMNLWFIVSLIKKRSDLADLAWGLGFVLLAWASLIASNQFNLRGLLITTLVTIWGLRLASHIYRRVSAKPEDARYAQWRIDWGSTFIFRSYLQIFILQGIFLFVISQSFLHINLSLSQPLTYLDLLGLVVWLTGFLFESIADKQLTDFVRNPENKGHLMTKGLWHYSRHPNYFGEVTQWWGIYLLSLSVGGVLTILSPLTITLLILFVSGVPLLEKKYTGRPDWEEYKSKTSVFLPLPPRS